MAFFTYFEQNIEINSIPDNFTLTPHPLCLLAAKKLQHYLKTQLEWQHNFGLTAMQEGPIIGKMFGVLVVKNQQDEIGYLAAFSGKLSSSNNFSQFVPPVFDTLEKNGFLNEGMKNLSSMSAIIKELKDLQPIGYQNQVITIENERKNCSIALQQQLFEQYHFLNQAGEEKSLITLFKEAGYKNPPAGAGECAAPKLLQYAFQNGLKPLALAEFWWGQSPKSATWKHEQFYAPCKEKCRPILKHMLT